MDVKGHNGYFGNEPVRVRTLKADTKLDELQKAIQNNNQDDLVVETAKGRVLIQADELNFKGKRGFPKVGESIKLDNLGIEGKVLLSDNESNEELTVAGAAGVAAVAGGVAGFYGGGHAYQLVASQFGWSSYGVVLASVVGIAAGAAGATTATALIAKAKGFLQETDTAKALVK